MNIEKEDLRVRRTRATLYRTILELIKTQSFESITVKQICEHSMINRATFYKHFLDKYHLLSETVKELTNQELPIKERKLSTQDIFKECLTFANDHKDLFLQVLAEERDSLRGIIKEDMRNAIQNQLAEKYFLDRDSIKLNLITEAHIGVVMNVIVWCLENDISEITEEIDDALKTFFD